MTDQRGPAAGDDAGLGRPGGGDPALRLNVVDELPAPPAEVFRALTEPELLAAWWGPHGFTMPSLELDLRVGGRYRFTMQPPEGEPFHLVGELVRLEPPTALAFTFGWEEADPDDVLTLVAIALSEVDGSTLVTVEQGTFATPARTALHRDGWRESLERLQRLLEVTR